MNNEYLDKLDVQIREAYGRLVYTQTTHLKMAANLQKKFDYLRRSQIFLSAVSTGGILASFISNKMILSWLSGLITFALFSLNLYFKDFNLAHNISKHKNAADKLWLPREKYISLLTDLCDLNLNEIKNQRDKLQLETAQIYSETPKTDKKSYEQAKNSLKNEEEQFFTTPELDRILPEHLRKGQQ